MEMYKKASKEALRVQTNVGLLSIEQLQNLPITQLDALAVSLESAYEASKGKSFIVKKTAKDKNLKLQFDIVLDILTTKYEESEAIKDAAEIKAHNQKILGLIAEKQEGELKGKSIDELKSLLKQGFLLLINKISQSKLMNNINIISANNKDIK